MKRPHFEQIMQPVRHALACADRNLTIAHNTAFEHLRTQHTLEATDHLTRAIAGLITALDRIERVQPGVRQ